MNQPDSSEEILNRIVRLYEAYSGRQDGQRIIDAYEFARAAHEKQFRATGEPYIIHPLATAEILTELEVDADTLIAALLHDTIEDTGITCEELAERFGADVAALVDGVTKLGRILLFLKGRNPGGKLRKIFFSGHGQGHPGRSDQAG
jgi:GTP pyrophosphokinase